MKTGYYVGLSRNPNFPGIISGPFETQPARLMPTHVVWYWNGIVWIIK